MSKNLKFIIVIGLIQVAVFSLGSGFLFAKETIVINNVKAFKKNNPDGNKYDFVQSYISALAYLRRNDDHNKKALELSEKDIGKVEIVKKMIKNIGQSNVNLRIARNLLSKYRTDQNGLMLKVADLFKTACEEQIDYNKQEKVLLDQLFEAVEFGTVKNFNLSIFLKDYHDLALARKESSKKILEASMLVKKVLVSSSIDEYGRTHRLGISMDERERLLKTLDQFYGLSFEGELRPGQTFLEASVAVIREMLEDADWKCLDG